MQVESLKKLPPGQAEVIQTGEKEKKESLLACVISEGCQDSPTLRQACTCVTPGAARSFWGILKEPVQSCLPSLAGGLRPPLLTKLLSTHRGRVESPGMAGLDTAGSLPPLASPTLGLTFFSAPQ